MLTGKNRFCSFSWSTLPVLLQFCSSAKPQQNFFSFRILWGAGLRDFLLAFIFLPPEVPCYHGPSFAQFWWFCILFSFCFCMSAWFEFCWVLLVLHSVLLLFVHVMMVRVLLSFAGFAFCFAFVSVCYHGPSFAEFCGFALRFLFVSAYFSSNDPETKNRLRTDNFLISFSIFVFLFSCRSLDQGFQNNFGLHEPNEENRLELKKPNPENRRFKKKAKKE